MALPVLPGVVRISVNGSITGGSRWSNTWHVRNDSLVDFNAGSIASLHAIFQQFYVGPALGAGSPQTANWDVGTTVERFGYTPLDGSSGAYDFTTSYPGTNVGACMPAEVAQVITVRTLARGRQNRGRIYLPAMITAAYTAVGHIAPAVINATLVQLQAVATAIIAGGAHIGVGSYGPYKDPVTHALVPGTPHFTEASQFTMDDLTDVMRNRKA
jgi:hypothetical protein